MQDPLNNFGYELWSNLHHQTPFHSGSPQRATFLSLHMVDKFCIVICLKFSTGTTLAQQQGQI